MVTADDDAVRERGEVLGAWAVSLRRRGLQETTIYRWSTLLRQWWDFVDGQVGRATIRDVERFLDAMTATSPRTRYSTVTALHQFYRWARRQGLSRRDPTEFIERPKLPPLLPRPIPDLDLALAVTLADPVMRAGLLLAAGCGLRAIEIARLRWCDVDLDTVRVVGKGSKDRVVPLHPATQAALLELDREGEYVFPWRSRPGHPGCRVSQVVNSFLHSIGVASTLHQLRHWFATKAYAQSHDIYAVQKLLGHANPNTTAIYARLDVSGLAPIVNAIEIPPLSGPRTDDHDSPGYQGADTPRRDDLIGKEPTP
jgi:integrase